MVEMPSPPAKSSAPIQRLYSKNRHNEISSLVEGEMFLAAFSLEPFLFFFSDAFFFFDTLPFMTAD